jgi:anti-anti-sigma factor
MMTRVSQEQGTTVVELDRQYESLDEADLLHFGGVLLDEAIHADPPVVVVDMAQTKYIGSSFIEILIQAWKRLKGRGGSLALCSVQPFCREVFETTHLDRLWPQFPTRAEALAASRSSG